MSSAFEVVLGFTGAIGFIMRFIGPLTIVPTITLTGLSLFGIAGFWAGKHWGITILYVGKRPCLQVRLSSRLNFTVLSSWWLSFLNTLHNYAGAVSTPNGRCVQERIASSFQL